MKIAVIVHPNSKRQRIEKDLLENLYVYVNQPPLEGKANRAAIVALASYFKVNELLRSKTAEYPFGQVLMYLAHLPGVLLSFY